jgi:hypothetical protein
MKTACIRTIEKGFQSALIISLISLFLFTANVLAQQKELPYIDQPTTAPGTWQANIFPSPDPLMLKIVFDNPVGGSPYTYYQPCQKRSGIQEIDQFYTDL